MRRRLRWLLPDGIRAQLAAVVIVSLALIHLAFTVVLLLSARPEPRAHGSPFQLIDISRLMAAAPDPATRAVIVSTAARAFPDLALAEAREPPATDARGDVWLPRRGELDDGFRMHGLGPVGADRQRVAVTAPSGATLEATIPARGRGGPGFGPLTVSLLFLSVTLALLAVWAMRSLIAPLEALAAAAQSFHPDAGAPPLTPRGPKEIRTALAAFDAMRERVRAMMDDRTRALTAIGHDLRTPVTRLRLRAEEVTDPALREHMLRDLTQMSAMVEGALAFLRGERSGRPRQSVDLAVCVATVCDGFVDLGHAVHYDGPAHLVLPGRADELERAVANLVENAVRYAGGATVRLSAEAGAAVVSIEDDGPGIEAALRSRLIEPFVRGDPARRADGGLGLGLSIARGIAEAHGGGLTLLPREPRGLTARIELPIG